MAQSNFIDRAIGVISPEAGRKRVASRRQMQRLDGQRGYDGAAISRRTQGWRAPTSSADEEIRQAGRTLRRRSRDLARNNPHVAKANSVWVSNIVGSGIRPSFDTGRAELDERLERLWSEWADTTACDLDGQQTFTGIQQLAVREMVEGGEGLVRRYMRSRTLKLQVHESEQIDDTKDQELWQGSRVVNGVQFDRRGQRTGYWLFPRHPGDIHPAVPVALDSQFVPDSEIAHLYEKQRQQSRGVPWCAPVMNSLRDLHDWHHAELVRKKTEAAIAGFVISDDAASEGMTSEVTDYDGNPIESFEPGMIAYLNGGKDIKFNTPTPSGDVDVWLRQQLRIIASGLRIPYELLTGDLSQVNYSSMRASLTEFRRLVNQMQREIVIPLLCEPVMRWFLDWLVIRGEIGPDQKVSVSWICPRFEAVDEEKSTKADIAQVRAGLKSLSEAMLERGKSPRATMKEIERTNEMLDNRGLIVDSDPRHVSGSGVAHGTQTVVSDEADADGENSSGGEENNEQTE